MFAVTLYNSLNNCYGKLTSKISTDSPQHSTTVRYSTAVGSQWSLDITLTIESDSLKVSDPVKSVTSDTVPGNLRSIRK